MDVVLEIVSNSGVLHSEHDKADDTYAGQHNPCFVHEQILEVFEHIVILFLGLRHTLLGRTERDEEERYRQHAEQANRVLVALCLINHAVVTDSTKPLDQIQRSTCYNELADVRRDKAVGVQSGTLVAIISHDGRERAIRQVDERIRRTEQQACDESISELTVQPELRGSERQDSQYSIRYRAEQQVGTELAPARTRTVGDDADYRIHQCIPNRADEHDDAR